MQRVMPTLTRLLGDNVGGVLGAARRTLGGATASRLRIIARDQHGRQVTLDPVSAQ